MKILAIRGENITSLPFFEVDFQKEPLRSSGLFAIWGPTGAGKSSLLDTMCLALFNRVPRLDDAVAKGLRFQSKFGEISQNDILQMIRRDATTCKAEVDFIGIDGIEYRAKWGYRQGARSGAGPKEEFSLIQMSDQQVIVLNSKTAYLAKITDLLGLSYGQFIRTIFLSQGRFAEFLKSDESNRSELLEKLTGTAIYTEVSQNIFNRAKKETEQLKVLNDQVSFLQLLAPEKSERLTLSVGILTTQIVNQEKLLKQLEDIALSSAKFQVASTNLDILKAELTKNSEELVKINKSLLDSEDQLNICERDFRDQESVLEKAVILDTELAGLNAQAVSADTSFTASSRINKELELKIETLVERIEKGILIVKDLTDWLASKTQLKKISAEWGRWQQLFKDCANAKLNAKSVADEIINLKEKLETIKTDKPELETKIKKLKTVLGDQGRKELAEMRSVLDEEKNDLDECQEYLRVLHKYDDAKLEQTAILEKRLKAQSAVGPSKDEFDRANQMYRDILEANGTKVESLRDALEDGKNCPVCGSTDHPYAGKSNKMKSLLNKYEDVKDKAQEKHGELLAEFKSLDSLYKAAALESAENKKELAEIKKPKSELFLKCVKKGSQEAQIAFLKINKVEINKRVASLKNKEDQLTNLQKLEQELKSIIVEENKTTAQIENDSSRLSEQEKRFNEQALQLDEAFGDSNWRSAWSMSPERFVKSVETDVLEYKRKEENLKTSQELLAKLEVEKIAKSEQLPDSLAKVKDDEKRLIEVRELVRLKTDERIQLVGSDPVPKIRERNTQQLNEKRKLHAAAKENSEAIKHAGASLIGKEEDRIKEVKMLSQAIAGLVASLPTESADMSEILDGKVLASYEVPDLKLIIDPIVPELTIKLRENIETKATYSALLAQDKALQSQALEMYKAIENQTKLKEKWEKLSTEIGSSDGKLFRKIAQAYTLEILMFHANQQLAQITPRYKLLQAGDSVNFAVVDQHDFDEIRSVHTLSGGETFIVSLALALGLSAMASKGLTIESLFIDEGFGALDSETLKYVMSALSQLQAQGRKVGLITHVEEMKEQIPTRIEVTPISQGTSSITVVG